ncbi:cytochrome c oxidase subunit II [Larsenimonas rhizosphaerae]|uniref:cytochrome c oxidase subunit II n=1 Tax=Larsenimonas rhizosphaerae TaxID=2944682 RepID=UPI0020340F4B|nr:hypothetical protein [Larsenimonas rhizosphaerae]MCM2130084.1 hypothetical protein [Larsenimonas rhizosphaerae]
MPHPEEHGLQVPYSLPALLGMIIDVRDHNVLKVFSSPAGRSRFGAIVSCLALLALSGCSSAPGFLWPNGPVADAQRQHLWLVIALVMIVVLPVFILTPWLVWRYRYKSQATYRPRWSFSLWVDVLIWGVPVVIVALLSVALWKNTINLDPYKPIASDKPPLRIQVIGLDWKWLFIYPDHHIATLGQLVIPVDRPVSFTLTSATVMQSFIVPALGGQIDVMNRMVTRLNLMADHTGEFMGRNMQYNGEGFYAQQFTTRAVSDSEFATFIDQVTTQGQPLNAHAWGVLKQQNNWKDVARILNDGLPPPAPMVAFSQLPASLFQDVARHQPIAWNGSTATDTSGKDTSHHDRTPAQ